MARETLILNNPTLKLADTQAGLDAAVGTFECQVNSLAITSVPVYNTIPATGCAGASQSPGRTGYQLDLTYLQDWGATESLSQYAFDNDGARKWYRFNADAVQYPDLQAEGECYVAAGSYGGTFGDGSAAQSTSTWPCVDKPAITNTPGLPLAGDAAASSDALADAVA
jgi:hypothetical protein